MACSRFEYVKQYEFDAPITANCWFVVRIDGRGFSVFAEKHKFVKPNDIDGCSLMVYCGREVMQQFSDIILSYGHSDEFSFLFQRKTNLWNRRHSKILTSVVSSFTSAYVYHWKSFFPTTELLYPPTFDGRITCYPTDKDVRDYFSWRQADCHINNQYNVCFWNLVLKSAKTTTEAYSYLSGTTTAEKNELLFKSYNTNYNLLPAVFRKGSTIVNCRSVKKAEKQRGGRQRHSLERQIVSSDVRSKAETCRGISASHLVNISSSDVLPILHDDIIADTFWIRYFNCLNVSIE